MTRSLHIFFLFCFFLFPLAICLPSLAQNKEVSESDKAIFAFFKLASLTPDYDQWIRNSEKYITSAEDPTLQRDIYEIESLRLKWGFGTYNPEQDFIKIRTPVKLALNTARKPQLAFIFPGNISGSVPYFPFPYGNEAVALIVGDLENFMRIDLSPEEFEKISSLIAPGQAYDAQLSLRVRPVSADGATPLKLDGMDQWLLMGETGYLEILYAPQGQSETALWAYTAPWYLSDTEKNLLPLLEKANN